MHNINGLAQYGAVVVGEVFLPHFLL